LLAELLEKAIGVLDEAGRSLHVLARPRDAFAKRLQLLLGLREELLHPAEVLLRLSVGALVSLDPRFHSSTRRTAEPRKPLRGTVWVRPRRAGADELAKSTERSLVLVLTHDAAAVIRSIVESTDISDEGGLRITARAITETEAALELAVAEEPEVTDQVVEQEGAQVFLEPDVAEALSDKVLDASVEEEGVTFRIEDQTSGPSFSSNSSGPAA
jgi:iron-sulfur cluster assembly protein